MITKICKWISILGAMTFAIALPACDQVPGVSNLLSAFVPGAGN